VIAADDSGRPKPPVPIRYSWPDRRENALGRTLPLLLSVGRFQLMVAPGELAVPPDGPVMAAAVLPGAAPLVAELRSAGDHKLEVEVPFSTSDVIQAAFEDSTRKQIGLRIARDSVAFDVTRWTDRTAPIPEDDKLRISREGERLSIGGQDETSGPLRFKIAGNTIPTRVIAVPRVGPDESAVINLGVDHPWGARPALMPSDDASRLLLSYLNIGEHHLAAVMARALASVRAERDPIQWASPSFAQLLIGYAYALDDDAEALAGWCRRTQAARFLGIDGLILNAKSAWQQGQPSRAAELLATAETDLPVMTIGLEVAVKLAFQIAAEPSSAQVDFGHIEYDGERLDGERLARLVTSYSTLSSAADPAANTVTTPTSQRRPVSLEGRSWWQRTTWAIVYRLTRFGLTHKLKKSSSITTVSLPRRAKQTPDRQGGIVSVNPTDTTMGTEAGLASDTRMRTEAGLVSGLLRVLIGSVVLAWLVVLAATVYSALFRSDGSWERLLIPLGALQAVVFALVGAGVTLLAVNGRSREFEMRAQSSERRAYAAEEQAMQGRALAAALQAAAAVPNAPDQPASFAAQLSENLLGNMIGQTPKPGGRRGDDGKRIVLGHDN
jgi:hypothetical protein